MRVLVYRLLVLCIMAIVAVAIVAVVHRVDPCLLHGGGSPLPVVTIDERGVTPDVGSVRCMDNTVESESDPFF